MPEIKPTLPPKLPEPFEGRLFRSKGRMIGEYEDVIAFPYRSYQDYKDYLHVIRNGEAKDYLLTNSEGTNSAFVSVVMTAQDEIWIAFNIPITINQYHIGSDAVTLVSSTTLGDSRSHLKDLIKLDNGKLFVAWHQFVIGKVDEEGNPGIDVGFAYRTLDSNWHTPPYTWVFPFGIPATQGAVCQHPADGSIWFFCQPDSRGLTCVIHLVEIGGEIVVDWTDYDFLNRFDGAMEPEGELPFFSAVADKERNAIILAYQSNDFQMFSVDPFCKGAKPAIIQVNSDASKSLLFVLDKWVERTNPLYVGLNDQNEIWLAYGKIDEVNLTWNDLYISTQSKDQYCGKMQYGIPKNAGVRLCNSSRLVVATMDDGYIHFYGVEGKVMPPIEPINDTTYEATLPCGDKVEIGDKEPGDFKPHIKLNRWGGECFIQVGLPTTKKIAPSLEGDKVKWTSTDVECHFYPLEPRTVIAKDKDGKDVEFRQCEFGGFEFEVILKEKPAKNTITLDIETQGLKFYYQPALTQKEKDEGCIRPDNVVGSYAAYHATRTPFHKSKADAEKYKCGKAFHIYRPKITDAEGKWVWGELSLDEQAGTLTTTIPQDFLDNAVYPISTGTSNFGYEDIGGSNEAIPIDMLYGSVFTSPGDSEGASVLSFTFHCGMYTASPPGNVKAVLVNAGTKTILTNGISDVASIPGLPTDWRVFTFSTPPTISADTSYALTAIPEKNQLQFDYDSATGDWFYDTSNSYSSPIDPTDAGTTTGKLSIYCTYEAAAEGTTVTPGTLSLTLTEYAPILKEVLTPTTLSLTTTTYVPVLKEVTTPSTLSLTTTGYAPVLREVTTPTALSLTLTSYTPILKEVVTPSTLSLSTTGYAPILAEVVTPTTLSLSLTGYIPILNASIVIGLLELVLTGYAPTLGEEAPFRHAWGIIFG